MDPPWAYRGAHTKGKPTYPTLTIAEIASFPLLNILGSDGVVLIWATSPKLHDISKLIDFWKLDFVTVLVVWTKTYANG